MLLTNECRHANRDVKLNRPTLATHRHGAASVVVLLVLGLISALTFWVSQEADNTADMASAKPQTSPNTERIQKESIRLVAPIKVDAFKGKGVTVTNREWARSWDELLLGADVTRRMLPADCVPAMSAESYDGKMIAWIGHRLSEAHSKRPELNLYVFEKQSLESRFLTRVAQGSDHLGPTRCVGWSPDGKRLVVGGLETMLAIVDVATGEVHQTGVSGTWTMFSPDSRFIVFSTPLRPNGSRTARFISGKHESYYDRSKSKARSHEVPQGGRIAIWNIADKKLTYVSEVGTDRRNGDVMYRSWGRYPLWSPDGKWIAWSQTISGETPKVNNTSQLWVARPDGTARRLAFKNGYWARWSRDSQQLTHSKAGKPIALDQMGRDAAWPTIPKSTLAAFEQVK